MYIYKGLLCVMVLLLFTGCSVQSAGNGEYQTGALVEFQKVMPFTIILPKYLPENIRSTKPTFQNSISDNQSSIVIGYTNKESDYEVYLEEGNRVVIAAPSKNSVFLTIKKIQIREEPYTERRSTEKSITGFRYDWNNNNVQYMLLICGYEQNECRKVLESLIPSS
jgi:hypothetical protein